MRKEELILRTKQKIDEIEKKVKNLRSEVEQSGDKLLQEKGRNIIKELDDISNHLQLEYAKLGSQEDHSGPELDEMDKNIYNTIQSFDSAFERAGSLFKTK